MFLKAVIKSLAYNSVLGKAINPGAPWSEKYIKTLSFSDDSKTLSVPLPLTASLLPWITSKNTLGSTLSVS